MDSASARLPPPPSMPKDLPFIDPSKLPPPPTASTTHVKPEGILRNSDGKGSIIQSAPERQLRVKIGDRMPKDTPTSLRSSPEKALTGEKPVGNTNHTGHNERQVSIGLRGQSGNKAGGVFAKNIADPPKSETSKLETPKQTNGHGSDSSNDSSPHSSPLRRPQMFIPERGPAIFSGPPPNMLPLPPKTVSAFDFIKETRLTDSDKSEKSEKSERSDSHSSHSSGLEGALGEIRDLQNQLKMNDEIAAKSEVHAAMVQGNSKQVKEELTNLNVALPLLLKEFVGSKDFSQKLKDNPQLARDVVNMLIHQEMHGNIPGELKLKTLEGVNTAEVLSKIAGEKGFYKFIAKEKDANFAGNFFNACRLSGVKYSKSALHGIIEKHIDEQTKAINESFSKLKSLQSSVAKSDKLPTAERQKVLSQFVQANNTLVELRKGFDAFGTRLINTSSGRKQVVLEKTETTEKELGFKIRLKDSFKTDVATFDKKYVTSSNYVNTFLEKILNTNTTTARLTEMLQNFSPDNVKDFLSLSNVSKDSIEGPLTNLSALEHPVQDLKKIQSEAYAKLDPFLDLRQSFLDRNKVQSTLVEISKFTANSTFEKSKIDETLNLMKEHNNLVLSLMKAQGVPQNSLNAFQQAFATELTELTQQLEIVKQNLRK